MFTSEHGAELLEEWRKSYVETQTLNSDPIVMAGRAAQKDFVTNIESIIREVRNWKS